MPTNGKITGQDIIDQSAISQVEKLDAALRKILQTYNEIAKSAQNATNLKQLNEALAKRNKNDKDAIDISTKLAKLKKEEANAEAAKERAIKAGLQTQKLVNSEEKKAIGVRSTNLAQFKSLNSAYLQQSRLLNSLRQRQKDLNIQKIQGIKLTKSEQSELRRLTNRIRNLDANLKKVDAAAGQFQRNVGNYPKVVGAATRSLRSFAGAFGFTSGIFLLVGALKSTFKIFKDFDQAQADLSAVLGKTRKETVRLTKQAKELGATTAFTATQVAKLQIELSKLGFNEDQILASAEAIENLAIATGVEAARAAKLAGAAIRGFNLDAEEANRVASVLAVSTTKSASSFETLEVALPKVSAIAKAFNFSIEDTVALLSGLQNAGFEASIAGTSLRQIFLQLADSNGKLAKRLGGNVSNFDELVEAFKRVEDEGIDLAEAFELTNARSVAAFKTFLQGADDLKILRDSITDVESELLKLADTKLDSLQGDITLLTSAWQGFVLAVEDGEGAISRFLRSTVKAFTNVFEFLKELNLTPEELQESFNKGLEQKAYLDSLANLEEEAIRTGKSIEQVARDQFFRFKTEADGAASEVQELESKIKNANKAIKEGGARGDAYSNELVRLQEELEKSSRQLAIKEGKLKSVNELIRSNKIETEESNKEKKIENDFLVNTIGYYEDLIKTFQKLQKNTAQNTDEFDRIQRNIDQARGAILGIQGAFDNVELNFEDIITPLDDIEFIDLNDEIDLSDFLNTEGVDSILQNLAQKTGATFEEIQEAWANVQDKNFANAVIFTEKYLELNQQKQERVREIYDGIRGVVTQALDSIFQVEINRLNDQIEANNEYYDNILDRENLTDQQRDQIQAAREAKDKKLREEQEKLEKQSFLVKQLAALAEVAIETFRSVAIIKAQAAILLSNPITAALAPLALSQIPLVFASGGVATAGILAQSIPAFFRGKDASNNYEGIATVNELPGQRELKVDKYGGVSLLKAGMHTEFIGKDDLIIPSMSDFNRQIKLPDSDLSQRFMANITKDTRERVQSVNVNNTIDLTPLKGLIEKEISKGFSKAKININNKIINESKYTKY